MRFYGIAVTIILFLTGCGQKEFYYLDSRYGNDYKDYHKPQTSKIAPKTSLSSTTNLSQGSSSHPTMRPYEVYGKQYIPTLVEVGQVESGIASWYGPDFHGKKTSNGELYDMYALTAAHKTFPMNTLVKVIDKQSGKSVTVRINDRGPFVEGRIIDLSFAAGKELGMDRVGTTRVTLEVLGFDNVITVAGSGDKERRFVGEFFVQTGAFREKINAEVSAKELMQQNRLYNSEIKYDTNKGLYRVVLRGFKSEGEARDFIKNERTKGAFILAE